jgi:hypothetical protein
MESILPRIRTIKPEFWEDEKIGSLSPMARLMFIGSWNVADDEGLLNVNPAYLKAQIFPYDNITVDDSRNILGELLELSLIVLYRDPKNKIHGWIPSFRKHQRIDKPQKAKHPFPNIHDVEIRSFYSSRQGHSCPTCGVELDFHSEIANNVPCVEHIRPRNEGGTDAPSNIRIIHTGCNISGNIEGNSENVLGTLQECSTRERKGKERIGKKEGECLAEKKKKKYSDEFEIFWAKIWPGKSKGPKMDAYREWKKTSSERPDFDILCSMINQHEELRILETKNGKWVPEWPHLHRWLKKHRWDELTGSCHGEKKRGHWKTTHGMGPEFPKREWIDE